MFILSYVYMTSLLVFATLTLLMMGHQFIVLCYHLAGLGGGPCRGLGLHLGLGLCALLRLRVRQGLRSRDP